MQSKRVLPFRLKLERSQFSIFFLNAFDATVHFRAAFLLDVGESEFWGSPSQVKLMPSAPKRCSSQEFSSVSHSESEWRQKGQRVPSCLKVYTKVRTNFCVQLHCTFGRVDCGSTLQICKCTKCICMTTVSPIKNDCFLLIHFLFLPVPVVNVGYTLDVCHTSHICALCPSPF